MTKPKIDLSLSALLDKAAAYDMTQMVDEYGTVTLTVGHLEHFVFVTPELLDAFLCGYEAHSKFGGIAAKRERRCYERER